MRLLTYHGTIVRYASASNHLSHHPLTQFDAGLIDAEFGPIGVSTQCEIIRDPILEIVPSLSPGTVNLRQAGLYMCAEPDRQIIKADRATPSVWETFLPLDETDVVVLRCMLQHAWELRAKIQGAGTEPFRPTLIPGFQLQTGEETIDLIKIRPSIQSCFVPRDTAAPGLLVFDRVDNSLPTMELALIPAPADPSDFPIFDRTTFLQRTPGALIVSATPEEAKLPITTNLAAIEYIKRCYWNNAAIPLGPQKTRTEIRQSKDKYVLLQPFIAGIIFDEHGTYSNAGYFNTLQNCPAGMRRDEQTIMLDRQLMQRAVSVEGLSAVIFNPHLRNYYHWMVECMLSLDMVAQNLPSDTRLILPGEVALYRANGATGFDHRRMMELLGFGHIPVIELESEVCHLEEALWVEHYMIHDIPANAVRRFRDRVRNRLGRNLPRTRRIYVVRAGARGIANDDEVRAFCESNGFTAHRLELTDDEEQIRIFQEAEFVIAPHGAGLANLMFCEPGTKVIELSPNLLFGPFFWQISEKLGLSYGVLPCQTSDGTFQGKMTVEVEQLRALYELVDGQSAGRVV